VVSGFGGRFCAHSTLKPKNLIPVANRKNMRKVIVNRIESFAKPLIF